MVSLWNKKNASKNHVTQYVNPKRLCQTFSRIFNLNSYFIYQQLVLILLQLVDRDPANSIF